ncbi:hypothetical protein [Actinomyces faecalis]|uniref:hypothetical protein n=1 Tax=Actinomyces faecalis TaxID=2722820 RepID=UPI00155733B4|nr:hypothetical protein [Actinomyces faecalis]
MSFFNVDDQAHVHPKHQVLIRRGLAGDPVAFMAGYLWVLMGSRLRAAYADGVLDRVDLYSVMPDPSVEQAAQALVEVGLWHDHDHYCDQGERCPRPRPGQWSFHSWREWSQRTGAQDRLRRALQTERKDSTLHDAVWERDRLPRARDGDVETALCAYCQRLVRRDTRQGPLRPEMDHVFARPMGLDGVAVSCHECNRSKGNRSASQAGMSFHPTPAHAAALARRDQDRSRPDQGPADLLEQAWSTLPPGQAVPGDDRGSHPAEGSAEPDDAGRWEPSLPERGGSSVPTGTQEQAWQARGAFAGAQASDGTRVPAHDSQIGSESRTGIAPAADQHESDDAPSTASATAWPEEGASRARTGPRAGARTGPRAADALSRPAGQGKAGQGQEEARQGQEEAGQGTAGPRKGHRRRRRGRKKPRPGQVCPEHGDRLPCRMCGYEEEMG